MISWFRKYRPGRVGDLDQDRVREFFLRVLKSGKITQAYLLTGPKGTGKTSSARIMAAVVNCETNRVAVEQLIKAKSTPQTLNEPCGKCSNCVAIKKGAATVVVEIDAASNRGIDDIRSLRDKVAYIPAGGYFNVYIIDEVHMLTNEAFNALLKTLEEPPAHVIFFLCTTDEQKLPATIVSRCTKISFTKASITEIEHSLARVVAGEKLVIEKEALTVIAQKADGSFRDGVKLLEQISLLPEMSKDAVSRELSGGDNVENALWQSMLTGDVRTGLELVERAEIAGTDMKSLAKAMLSIAVDTMKQEVLSSGKTNEQTIRLIEIISKAFSRFADVPIPALPLEMAIVEAGLKPEVKLATKTITINQNTQQAAVIPLPQVKAAPVPQMTVKVTSQETVGVVTVTKEETVQVEPVKEAGEPIGLEQLKEKWGQILRNAGDLNHGLETILRTSRLVDCAHNEVKLGVGYKFHKERLEQDKYLAMIEKAIDLATGCKVRIKIELLASNAMGHNQIDPVIDNITGKIAKEDQILVESVEEALGL